MKHILYIFALAITTSFVSCRSTEKAQEKKELIQNQKVVSKTAEKISNNQLEHDIVIVEPKFNSWLTSKAKPKGDYDLKYLEDNNLKYVKEWNARVSQPKKYSTNLYESQITYNQGVNYGYDVNYKLYYYFIYFQNRYKQNLLGGTVPTN